jgi:AhpD family alkylhydroperoxidase
MTTFKVPSRNEVSPANQQNFDILQKALGMVPNLYATIAYSDNGLSRYLAFQGAKTSLTNKEKEAINLVVSEVNGCRYCQSAHTVIGKLNGFSDEEITNIRKGHSIKAKLDALIVLAKDITQNRGRINEAHLVAFYAAGYNNGNLIDVILQVSDKTAMNYLHNLTGIPIDFPIAAALNEPELVEYN